MRIYPETIKLWLVFAAFCAAVYLVTYFGIQLIILLFDGLLYAAIPLP
jgi:hypothetical protein